MPTYAVTVIATYTFNFYTEDYDVFKDNNPGAEDQDDHIDPTNLDQVLECVRYLVENDGPHEYNSNPDLDVTIKLKP